MSIQSNTKSFLSTLTTPILKLLPESPETSATPASAHSSHPQSWICHHCIYLLPTESSLTNFSNTKCHGCGHDRCGHCDVVFVEDDQASNTKKVEVVDLESGQAERMCFNYDDSDTEAAAEVAEQLH